MQRIQEQGSFLLWNLRVHVIAVYADGAAVIFVLPKDSEIDRPEGKIPDLD